MSYFCKKTKELFIKFYYTVSHHHMHTDLKFYYTVSHHNMHISTLLELVIHLYIYVLAKVLHNSFFSTNVLH